MFKLLLHLFLLWVRPDAVGLAFRILVVGGLLLWLARQVMSPNEALIAGGLGAVWMIARDVFRRMDRARREAPTPERVLDANREASRVAIERLVAAIDATPDLEIPEREARIASLDEMAAEGEWTLGAREILSTLLAERLVDFCVEEFVEHGMHASVVEAFAEASQGAWRPGPCTSTMDPETGEKCSVEFEDGSETVQWRFSQSSDTINPNFLDRLIKHVETHSPVEVLCLDGDFQFEALVLPREFHERLVRERLLASP